VWGELFAAHRYHALSGRSDGTAARTGDTLGQAA
jgi:hypothetical protein